MKINILGTDYEITEQTAKENPKLDDYNGICEQWSKKIILNSDILKPHKLLVEQPELYKNKVLRHEIVHAFFHESGLSEYRDDETLVDYLAVQLPKMVKSMQGAGCWDEQSRYRTGQAEVNNIVMEQHNRPNDPNYQTRRGHSD